jgi:hypothetical protein
MARCCAIAVADRVFPQSARKTQHENPASIYTTRSLSMRRGLMLAEASAIGTAWLRTKLIDGGEAYAIAWRARNHRRKVGTARFTFGTVIR